MGGHFRCCMLRELIWCVEVRACAVVVVRSRMWMRIIVAEEKAENVGDVNEVLCIFLGEAQLTETSSEV